MTHDTTQQPVAFGRGMKQRHPWGVWLVAVLTLGLYFWYWHYAINRELRDLDSRSQFSPGLALTAVTLGAFVYVPPFVSVYKTGERIAFAQRDARLEPTCSGGLSLVLYILLLVHMPYQQRRLNEIAASYGVAYGERIPHYE